MHVHTCTRSPEHLEEMFVEWWHEDSEVGVHRWRIALAAITNCASVTSYSWDLAQRIVGASKEVYE